MRTLTLVDMPKGKFTKEEEKLIEEYSRKPTKGVQWLFYVNAFIVAAIPICEIRLGPHLWGSVIVFVRRAGVAHPSNGSRHV